MTVKPWIVRTPMGTVWIARFRSEDAAWRRVVRPMKRQSESEEACKARLQGGGWVVYTEDMNKAAKEAP